MFRKLMASKFIVDFVLNLIGNEKLFDSRNELIRLNKRIQVAILVKTT